MVNQGGDKVHLGLGGMHHIVAVNMGQQAQCCPDAMVYSFEEPSASSY